MIGGSAPKQKRTINEKCDSQTLNHTTDKYTIKLNELVHTPETILYVMSNSVIDLKPTIEEEVERKRALKIVLALHVVFCQATDSTFLSDSLPVFKSFLLQFYMQQISTMC